MRKTNEILSKRSYRAVLKRLEHLKKQDEEDKKENPGHIPIGWRSSICAIIEKVVRDNGERYYRGMESQVIEYLIEKGILIRYYGDVTFPQELPTEKEILLRTKKEMQRVGLI